MPMCIMLKDFLHFKKMPRHKYFRHLIIQGGPKMHFYLLAQEKVNEGIIGLFIGILVANDIY